MSKVRDSHEEFAKDLQKVCELHGATSVCVCATMPDETFYGACLVESGMRGTPTQMMNAALGVARLWQHAREALRTMLDSAERGW